MLFLKRSTPCFLPVALCCRWLVVACLLFFGVGCGTRLASRRQPAAATNIPGPAAVRYLGKVHVIGTGGRFVLVQASVAATATELIDGQTLVCRAPGADTATLHVSHERRPPFVVADVASGEPHVGDEVFVESAAKPPLPARVSPAPGAPAASTPPLRAGPSLPPAT